MTYVPQVHQNLQEQMYYSHRHQTAHHRICQMGTLDLQGHGYADCYLYLTGIPMYSVIQACTYPKDSSSNSRVLAYRRGINTSILHKFVYSLATHTQERLHVLKKL